MGDAYIRTVSEFAVRRRINRRLAQDGQRLHTSSRFRRCISDTGSYYITSIRQNTIEVAHVDLESLGHELGVLKPWEVMVGTRSRK